MLNSARMADSRPTVLVTESGIPESRSPLPVGARAGVPCARRMPRPISRRPCARRRATYVIVGRATLRRTAVRSAAAGWRHRPIRRRARRHRQGAKPPRPVSSAPTRRASSISRSPNTRCCSSAAAARPLLATSTNMTRHVWDPALAWSCRGRRSRSSGAAASGAPSRASPRSATACGWSAVRGRTCRRPRRWSTLTSITNDFAIAVRRGGFRQPAHDREPRERPFHQSRAAGASRRAHLADQHRARIDRRRSRAVRRAERAVVLPAPRSTSSSGSLTRPPKPAATFARSRTSS